MEKRYDAVVIGAGNGGLAAAIRLAQSGAKTLLVEKHNLPGGFATSFRRGRFEFEASLHELNDFGQRDNAGELRGLFDELGVTDRIEWTQADEAYRVISRAEKLDAEMPLGVDAYLAKMESYVPGSREPLKKFFDLAEEIRRAHAYNASVNGKADPKYMVSRYGNFVRCGSYSVSEVLKALKIPQRAVDILSAYWCYLGAHFEDMSFVHYASMVNRYLSHGISVPKMRSHEMSLALAERFRELGGEILFRAEAVRILTDEKGVAGVVLRSGARIETRHVVANCSPHAVFGGMMDSVPEAEIRAANARKFAGRGFTVFLGLDKSADELGVFNHNYFIYDTMDTVKQYDAMRTIRDNDAQATVCLNRAYPECSPPGTTMIYFTTLYMSDVWAKVKPEDYHKTKNAVAKKLIDRFEQATGAEIHGHIEEIAVASPMTYARYGGHPQGGIYGYESQYWDGLMPRILMMDEESKVRGLRFAGGYSVRLSGYSSAYFSGDYAGRLTAGDIAKEA